MVTLKLYRNNLNIQSNAIFYDKPHDLYKYIMFFRLMPILSTRSLIITPLLIIMEEQVCHLRKCGVRAFGICSRLSKQDEEGTQLFYLFMKNIYNKIYTKYTKIYTKLCDIVLLCKNVYNILGCQYILCDYLHVSVGLSPYLILFCSNGTVHFIHEMLMKYLHCYEIQTYTCSFI